MLSPDSPQTLLTGVAIKRQKIRVGDVVRIMLGHGSHTYAQVLTGGSYVFYNCRTKDDLTVEDIVRRPILFFVAVADYGIKENRWQIIGTHRSEEPLVPPAKFIQDPLNINSFSLYFNDGKIVRTTRDECVGLERAASWDPEQIEDRIRDHYADRQNEWLELLRMQ